MSISPVYSRCSRQKELASGSDAQRVPWNIGPKCLSTGFFAFQSPQFPTRPKACSQARLWVWLLIEALRVKGDMSGVVFYVEGSFFMFSFLQFLSFFSFFSFVKRTRSAKHANVFIMGYVTFSLGCYMVCCSVASLAVGYIFELFSFIFIRVLRPSLRPQNYVWCRRRYSSEHRFS